MEKQNIEPAINYLMRTKGIKKQKDLLKILYEGYIKKATDPDFDKWIKNQESNFSSMKKGERTFTPEFKYALSELSGLSFTEFCKLPPKKDDTPFQKGIRECVKEEEYNNLLNIINTSPYDKRYEKVLTDCEDEFGKRAIDYIIELKNTNGLKFFLDTKEWEYYDINEARTTALFSFVIELNDAKLFDKLLNKTDYLHDYLSDKHNDLLEKILNAENILNYVAAPQGSDKKRLHGCFYDLMLLAEEKGDNEKLDLLFCTYEKYIKDQIKRYLEENGPTTLLKANNVLGSAIDFFDFYQPHYENLGIALNDKYGDRFKTVMSDGIITALTEFEAGKMEDGAAYANLLEEKVYHKKEWNEAFKLMKLMTEHGEGCVPKFYGEEDGLKIVQLEHSILGEYFPDEKMIDFFGTIHRVSESDLGKGRVYSYKDFFLSTKCFSRQTGFYLGGWIDNIIITTPQKSIANLVIFIIEKIFDRNPYYGNDSVFKSLEDDFSAYYAPSHLYKLGDNILEEIELQGKEILEKKDDFSKYGLLMKTKAYVEFYKDKFNEIGENVSKKQK